MSKLNKLKRISRSILPTFFVIALMGFFVVGVYAASTIGTNMLTTGTFTQTVGSATAAQFQNAAGTVNTLTVDTLTNSVGVGTSTPVTTFEVQGTASASYFVTANTIQIGSGYASKDYSRFGTGATGHSLAAADDVLFSGLVEFDDNAFFDAKASISGNFQTAGRFIFGDNGDTGEINTSNWDVSNAGVFSGLTGLTTTGQTSLATASISANFQTAGRFILGDNGDTGEINTSNWDVSNAGVFSGLTGLTTTNNLSGATASFSGNFQISARFIADTAASHSFAGDVLIEDYLIVAGTTASNSGATYVAEFGGGETTATVSLLFGSNSASSAGTCFQMKDMAGEWVYLRINAEVAGTTSSASLVINNTSCHGN